MFVGVIRKSRLQKLLPVILVGTTALLCLYRPQALANGVRRGLSVCAEVIIPTLYPFMLLAGLLTETALCRRPGKWLTGITRWLFGLPGCCGPAILLSLVGGYPAGALAIGRLLRQGAISRDEARRMTLFCVNAGPGFIISTVGSGLLGSVRAGALLFAAHAGVSLATGIALGKGHRTGNAPIAEPATPPRPFAGTVTEVTASLLGMCGFVVLGAAGLSLLEGLQIPLLLQRLTGLPAATVSAGLAALLEVSCGCIALSGSGWLMPFWLCLCMGWGGLSVQGQLATALGQPGLLERRFVAGRLAHGILSGLVALVLFRLFPVEPGNQNVLAPGTSALPFSVTGAASGMLLILSFFAMLCFSPKNTGKTKRDVL